MKQDSKTRATDRFKDYLNKSGLVTTRERLMIAETVCRMDTVFNVEKLHSLLHKAGNPVSLATIYRNINLLTKAGMIENLNWSCSGKSLFRKLEPQTVSCIIECTNCDCKCVVSNYKFEQAVLQLCKAYDIEQTGIVINIKGRRKCNCKHKKEKL